MSTRPPPGALRSRLVAKLTGLSTSQLQQFHAIGWQPANRRAGSRGVPRLYSWVDYRRLRVIAHMLDMGLSAARAERATRYLDELFPGWELGDLVRYEVASPPHTASGRVHAGHPIGNAAVFADAAGQVAAPELLGYASSAMRRGVDALAAEGALGRMSPFADVVEMRPDINAGLPTIRGTRLESSFIAELATLSSPREVATLYALPQAVVLRALEFEEAA